LARATDGALEACDEVMKCGRDEVDEEELAVLIDDVDGAIDTGTDALPGTGVGKDVEGVRSEGLDTVVAVVDIVVDPGGADAVTGAWAKGECLPVAFVSFLATATAVDDVGAVVDDVAAVADGAVDDGAVCWENG
jgi:hypothetical protein